MSNGHSPKPETTLETALAWAQAWHLEEPASRRSLTASEVRDARVLFPIQVRIETWVERRILRVVPLASSTERTFEPEPERWSVDLPVPELSDHLVRTDALAERPRGCPACAKSGIRRCDLCDGDGRRGLDLCELCEGAGERRCEVCEGSGAVVARFDVERHFRRHVRLRVHEDEGHEVGPHALLYLVDHAAEGEVIHDQTAPRIERYVGKGAGGGYRDVPTRLAGSIDEWLGEPPEVPEEGRIVSQRLVLSRVPVYVLELGRGRSVQVYGSPPRLSPESALRPAWLAWLPGIVVAALLVLVAAGFYYLMTSGR
ncbi:MAG: hypothetical protein H6721_04655 [Sandaracinus sp.]|nr:hypothetical protein [Myxococcales bacterium]MCB9619264.1 hypothetical protein [Sandaracinus sp.]MCB9621621.1 hypothetical protein [Sandaracinus sp.]MCB9631417.1 hypothetical protein [Sandaracinus sp.]